MKARKRSPIIEVIQFDPQGIHKTELPDKVVGSPSPNADNWAYEGCLFYVQTLGGRHEIKQGDWLLEISHVNIQVLRDKEFHENYDLISIFSNPLASLVLKEEKTKGKSCKEMVI